MRIRYEFRIFEELAQVWLLPDDGEKLGGSVRKLVLYDDDPRLQIVRSANTLLESQEEYFYIGSTINFEYTKRELEKAELFRIIIPAYSTVAGERCGTTYDESNACPICGSGASQVSPLRLTMARLPRSSSLFNSLAGELLINSSLRKIFEEERVTVISYLPVFDGRRGACPSDTWHQIGVDGDRVNVSRLITTGTRIFDLDRENKNRCPRGDLIGLNIHSEVYVESNSWKGLDFTLSQEYFGVRRGLLRPYRCLFVTPRVWRLLGLHKVRRYKYEIAHLV